MNFNNIINKKKYFNSINELKKDLNRNNLLSQYELMIEHIKQDMFDYWDVENIYLTGDIIEINKFNVNKIDLIVEISKDNFEKMVDAHYIDKIKDINFIFKVDNNYWKFNKKWEEIEIFNSFKLLI